MRGPVAAAGVAAAIALTACGDDGPGSTTHTAGRDGTVALRCPATPAADATDARGDPAVQGSLPPESVRSPAGDIASARLRRGDGGVLCLTLRLAATVRAGTTVALTTAQRAVRAPAGSPAEQQRYEIALPHDGGPARLSRPHGEPRYPVRGTASARGPVLEAVFETLLDAQRPFAWQVEAVHSTDPVEPASVDRLPDTGWLR